LLSFNQIHSSLNHVKGTKSRFIAEGKNFL
jgi:hypothetical protein